MTTRRSHLILVFLLLAAVVGSLLLIVPGSPFHKKPTLGLDLQGGLEVVLQAQPTDKNYKLTSTDLDRSVAIMRARVDSLGVSEPEIRKQGSDQIVIELAGVKDPAKAARFIGTTAQLQLFDLETSVTGPSQGINAGVVATPSLFDLLSGQQTKVDENWDQTQYYLFGPKKHIVNGPLPDRRDMTKGVTFTKKAEDGKKITADNLPKGYKIFGTPKNTVVITCGSTAAVCPGQATDGSNLIGPPPPGQFYYYLFKYDRSSADPKDHVPQMTGSDLKLSGTQADVDPQSNQPQVLMQFTGKGGSTFHRITRDEWRRGNEFKKPQHFAVVLDGQIKSFPQIDPNDSSLSDGIDPVNGARITGLKDMAEAQDIARVLQTGALPVNFVKQEQTVVSATLGKDSLQQAKTAAIGGLVVVALFLLLLYRFLGLVAVIGLAIYVVFLYAAILILGVTLTLPGFAGMILTIGVAADANVVIFERIKEEVRAGKSVRAAIAAGYAKGFHTIVDANVVTAITALILFGVATAGVKGFALMLLIGTVISLVTAVAATRAMLGLLAGFKWFENPRFMGASGTQKGRFLQVDFMGRRNLWFAISGAVVLISLLSLGVRGLNLGIDFKGGTQITFQTSQPTDISAVRDQAKAIGQGDAVVQGRGKAFGDKFESFQMRTKSLDDNQLRTLQNDLGSRVEGKAFSVKNVSSSFGKQIAKSALLAIIVSLLLIVFYIWFRFDRKFAGPVIIALLHDIVITVGVYSLTGREVTTATVAAVLTVLGYSIYDTIIIFDRVRENIPLMKRSPFAEIANVSLWETIRRSLATTFITLLPVASLFLFGGDTLKDFAFALLVGVVSGAYSSIFIAAPLLTMWKEREPEFARRIVGGEDDGPDGGSPARRRPFIPRPGSPAADAGTLALQESEAALAAEPTPGLLDAALRPAGSQAKRERRQQRRRTRPHGRAR